MNIERHENITINPPKPFIQVVTERTEKTTEGFLSLKSAMIQKEQKKREQTGLAGASGISGVGAMIIGLEKLLTNEDPMLGIELLAVGGFLLNASRSFIDRRSLIVRQLEKLKVYTNNRLSSDVKSSY
jgi:hypothetical protein